MRDGVQRRRGLAVMRCLAVVRCRAVAAGGVAGARGLGRARMLGFMVAPMAMFRATVMATLMATVALGLALAPSTVAAAEGAEPQPATAAVAAAGSDADHTVVLVNRRIVSFRATVGGDTPAQRVASAQAALKAAAARGGPGEVRTVAAGSALRLEVDGQPMFFLLAEDLGGVAQGGLLEAGAQKVAQRLHEALQAAREARDPRALATGAAHASLATLALAATLWGLHRLRRRVALPLVQWAVDRTAGSRLAANPNPDPNASPVTAGAGATGRTLGSLLARQVPSALRLLNTGLSALVLLVALDLWASYVLQRFAYTRPWGEALTQWLVGLLERFALGMAAALPGLATALLVFALARLATRGIGALMARVERGELQLAGLDADTAGPTRRVGNLLVWLFALAMAYPYLPGASSESFKGVSVLAGLMLSLGASGVVGQAVAGLTLMYARALRVGEYVKVGDTEGTVTALGLFTTRVQTGMGEEVSLPNAHVMALPVRNFSRLVADGRFVLHTGVTIGYATPWRQVHALLLEAARRTPGVATEPAPYVIQTALSDFYVEYRLCCQGDRGAPSRRAEAMNALHAHIQDVFNENGVQIMSPHYLADPPEPQVVAPGPWAPATRGPLPPPAGMPPVAQPKAQHTG